MVKIGYIGDFIFYSKTDCKKGIAVKGQLVLGVGGAGSKTQKPSGLNTILRNPDK